MLNLNVDFRDLARKSIPNFLRKDTFLEFLYAMVKPFKDINDDLVSLDGSIRAKLKINSQVIALEKYLNDLYDASLRNIKVLDNSRIDRVYWRRKIEERSPIYLYRVSEGKPPYYLRRNSEIQNGFDFTIEIPGYVTFTESILRAQVGVYKVAGKEFNIVII